LTDAQVSDYGKDKTQTKQVKLERQVPVELRYETIVVEDGKLHIYRDVYDQETNTEENLRAVLEANGVRFDDLTEAERTQVLDALAHMSGKPDAAGTAKTNASPATAGSARSSSFADRSSNAKKKTTAVAKNQKEIVIEIGALQGKGYPSPVAFDTGSGKTRTTLSTPPKRDRQ